MKTMKKHWKNVHKLAHDEIQRGQRGLTINEKLKQNKNVPKTIGESKIFEGRMITKSEIVKIHLIFNSLLNAQKRHVHETMENVTPAQRCRIDEIGAT